MTAHPQTQPLPGTVPASPPAPPIAQEPASHPKGASRNARTALGLSALVAIAGISFAIGHVTAEQAASGNIVPFADGAAPVAAGVAQAAADTEVAEAAAGSDVSAAALPDDAGPGAGAGRPGLASAAAVETDADAGPDITSIELVETAQADPAGPPDAGAGSRPGFAGAPAGSEGTVAEINASSLTVTAADGTDYTFAVDGTTRWVGQEAIETSAVQVGDAVVVEAPLGPGADDVNTTVATLVVLTTTGV